MGLLYLYLLPRRYFFFHQFPKKAWVVLIYNPFPYTEVKTTLEEEMELVLGLEM